MSKDPLKSVTVTIETESGAKYTEKLDETKSEAFQRATGCTVHEVSKQQQILCFWANETIAKNIIPKLPKVQ